MSHNAHISLSRAKQRGCVRGRTDSRPPQALYWGMARAHVRAKRLTPPVGAAGTGRENLLLATLPEAERRRFVLLCEPIELRLGEVLCEQGARLRHVYFPTGAFISLISAIDDRPRLELGLIGTEGMLGITLLLDVDVAPLQGLVQGSGSALRMEAARFSRELKRSRALQRALNSYLYVLMSQLAQMAACTRFHLVEARLARWLLMTRDRAHSDDFYLTQEFIAYMLGVRRVGISRAARILQKRKLIRYARGNVTVLDGRGLEAMSCGCYAVARDLYDRHMSARAQ
jgi:CRP-like cAMP-binding protein